MIFDITPIIGFLNAHTANRAHNKESSLREDDICEEDSGGEADFIVNYIFKTIRFTIVVALLFFVFTRILRFLS